MEKRIALEKRGRPESDIKELNLDNAKSSTIEGLSDKFTALETLSLINVGLVTLKNFPALPNLKRLELSDNRLSGGLQHISGCPNLVSLNLSGNRIKNFDEIRPLATLPKLEVLDLFNNDITQIENYRERMFEILGNNLKYLDGFDKNEVEAPSDEDEENGNDSEVDYEGEESDDNDCSLADVYNDDLGDDNDDWEGDGEEVEEEEDLDEEEEEGETPNNSTSENAENSQSTQGKKRKHDDDD